MAPAKSASWFFMANPFCKSGSKGKTESLKGVYTIIAIQDPLRSGNGSEERAVYAGARE
jgi:hypothetical protein